MNYTKEQTEYMVAEYSSNPCRETVDRLAEELEKSPKSVIGKLSREGVYRREVYKTKLGDTPITKLEIVANIEESLGVDPGKLKGLDKTPKLTLLYLERVLNEGST